MNETGKTFESRKKKAAYEPPRVVELGDIQSLTYGTSVLVIAE